jgi:hypothetical protein
MKSNSKIILNQAKLAIYKASRLVSNGFIAGIYGVDDENYSGEKIELITEEIGRPGYELSEKLVDWDTDINQWELAYDDAREKAAQSVLSKQVSI